jgi:histidinol dehydrogenase
MRIFRYDQPGFEKAIKPLDRTSTPGDEVRETVAKIIRDIRERGDSALLEYTEKFGGPKLKASQLQVTHQEIERANSTVSAETREAVLAAHANVRDFAKKTSQRKATANPGAPGTARASRSANASIPSSASAFTSPAAPPRSSPPPS